MGFPGGWEWFVILLIALLIFGSRLPSVMRSLGSSVNEFKRGLSEEPKAETDEDGQKELAEAEMDEEAADEGAEAEQKEHVNA